MAQKALPVSIVIPVYNEEGYIGACLDAIEQQTAAPLEVVVVDNNSSDRTIEIAKRYKFVKILHEKRQGQVFAQATGFNAAKGKIVARIDADTIVPAFWVEQIQAAFSQHTDLLALTGTGKPYDIPMRKAGELIFSFYHHWMSSVFAGHTMIWGSNCAFRTDVWSRIKGEIHMRADIWEDYDLAFHIAPLGNILYDKHLSVACSFRTSHKPLGQQIRYQFRGIRTFRMHRSMILSAVLFVCWYSMLLLAPLAVLDRYLWLLKQKLTRA